MESKLKSSAQSEQILAFDVKGLRIFRGKKMFYTKKVTKITDLTALAKRSPTILDAFSQRVSK
jgi:hypothetical protein